jgi:Zn-dependent alcohol dehydrogenase
MKAAICYVFGQPLVIEEVELAPPQKGEVKVKMAATAVCHSDVHLVRGDWGGDVPVVAGHEAAGIVEEVGEGVTGLKPGDRVVVSLLWSCGHCHACMSGSPHLCEAEFPHVSQGRLRNQAGERLEHGIRTAAFADYAVVAQSQVVAIPGDVPLAPACLLACSVITGLGAVVNTARVAPGQSVAVIGTGGVGLNSVQGARLSSANPIIAVDLLENKLRAAVLFGATHTVNASSEDPVKSVKRLTGGRGAEHVFVTVGSPQASEQAIKMAATHGSIVFAGIPDWKTTVALPIGPTVWSEKRIMGSRMGSTRLHLDVPRLVSLYQDGRLKLDELISGRYPLERINEAIEEMEGGAALRNVIVWP